MSLKIRLAKMGGGGKTVFRIVVVPTRSKRDGGNLDILGFYNPSPATVLKIDQKKFEKWLNCGAQPSTALRKILSAGKTK